MENKTHRKNRIWLWGDCRVFVFLAALVLPSAACATGPGNERQPTVSEPTKGVVDANGIRLAYESFGTADRETVLLIGGTGQQLIDWPTSLVNDLVQRGYRVVVFDNRDSGLSTKLTEAGLPDTAAIAKAVQEGQPPPLPYTIRDMADDAVGLLDALGIEKAHVAGISMGGAIAQLIAIDHPEHTLSLTSMMADSGNPALPVVSKPDAFAGLPPAPAAGDKQALIEYMVKTRQVLGGTRYPVDEAEARKEVERDVARSYDPAALARQQTVAFLAHYDPIRFAGLQDIHVPTVVLQGTDDPIRSVDAAREIATKIDGADLRVIDGLGHDIPPQFASQVADAIVAAASSAGKNDSE